MDRDEIGVAELRGGAGLAQEAVDRGGIAQALWMQDLERHLAIERLLLGEVDITHAAATEQAFDLVAEDLGARWYSVLAVDLSAHGLRIRLWPGRRWRNRDQGAVQHPDATQPRHDWHDSLSWQATMGDQHARRRG